MKLIEAVAIASAHPEASMTFSVNGEDGHFTGHVDMSVHTPGDGGFMANKASASGPGFLIKWDTVGHWSLSLFASGKA